MKKYLIFIMGFILGIIGTSYAAYKLTASQISFDKSKTDLNSDNVQDSIDEVTALIKYGDAEESDITNGKTALVKGKKIVGSKKEDKDTIVASWLTDNGTDSTSWVTFAPTVYDSSYLNLDNSKLIIKKPGKYKIYYQTVSDNGGHERGDKAYIQILINSKQVGSCSSNFARCDNKEVSYTTDLSTDDTIEVQTHATSTYFFSRVSATIVYLSE